MLSWLAADRCLTSSIKCSAKEQPYESKESTLKAAVDVAYRSGKDGEPAKVMVCDTKHAEAHVFWTYGVDIYPPAIKAAAEPA